MIVNDNTPLSEVIKMRKYIGSRVGIELEYEGCSGYDGSENLHGWRSETDHSLRNNGIEFISPPLKAINLKPSLANIKEVLDNINAKISKRCGLHVHLNVSDLTFGQLFKVFTYYALMEPFIFKQFADGREDSHFCVPLWANTNLQRKLHLDANRLYKGIDTDMPLAYKLKSAQFSAGLTSQTAGSKKKLKYNLNLGFLTFPKYSALNVAAVNKFGTLEFRQHPATLDMNKIYKWCMMLIKLRQLAIKFDDSESIMREFEENGFTSLCTPLGLKQSPDILPEDIEDAIDGASLIVGHMPTDPNTLDWEIN